jgi:Fe-S-cluster containining protein
MPENERNLCTESGCKAACCRNMVFWNTEEKELRSAFPKAIEIGAEDNIYTKDDAVYFKKRGLDMYTIIVKGKCPNLDDGHNCKIYETRPEACKTFKIGHQDCNNARQRIGLGMIALEDIK